MRVADVAVRETFDSRGESTIEVSIQDGNGAISSAQIPSGKSRGGKEAVVLPYARARIAGKVIRHAVSGKRYASIREFDRALLRLDSTPRKQKLGGNVMLGVSVAFARGLAAAANKEIWRILEQEFFSKKARVALPVVFSNVINGGAHASNNLDIQEYLVLVRMRKPLAASVKTIIRFYEALGGTLKRKYRMTQLPVGDEDGYSLDFKNNFEPLDILSALIRRLHLQKDFSLGLDAAASNFYRSSRYRFERARLTTDGLLNVYRKYFRDAKLLFSLEDPFEEEDHAGFLKVSAAFPEKLIVGDDLTVTDHERIAHYAQGCVIIKPNQVGTVSGTCQAIRAAQTHKVACIISHRSGETGDNFIIHLARASRAYGVKIGAPVNERVPKFDELIRIYE